MIQITNPIDLVGKTIASTSFEEYPYHQEMHIKFTDDTFVIIQSDSDFETGYHRRFCIKEGLTDDDRYILGIIDEEEYELLRMKERLERAKVSLEILKRDFPQLFK